MEMYVFFIQDDSTREFCLSYGEFRESYREEEVSVVKKKASISRNRLRYRDDMPYTEEEE